MTLDTIESLLHEQLRDLYSAENQLTKALPKMARKATSPALKDAFESHLEETRTHVERLQEIGEELGLKLGGHKCEAMAGLIKEGSEVLDADGDDVVIDAALIAAAQRVEHYEISAYGTTRAFAEAAGESNVASILQETLDEEGAADKKLTQICEGELLPNAPTGESKSDEEEESAPRGTRGASSRARAAGAKKTGGSKRATARGASRAGSKATSRAR